MKILIVSDAWHPQVNGVVRTYEHLSAELIRMGHDVRVIGPSDFPVRVPLISYPEIKLAVLPYFKLKRMIEDFQPDHIHVATEGPLGWAGRNYCLRHGRQFSTTYHTQFPQYVAKRIAKLASFLYTPVEKFATFVVRSFHNKAKCMFVATQSLEDELVAAKFKPRKVRLVRGVRQDIFKPGEQTEFKDLKHPIAIYVGRIAIEKNLEEFLKMDWDGSKVLVGDGPSFNELKKAYPDAVFVGKKEGEALGACYRSADVFVFPSRTDTFGMVLIEALGSGLPVAAYDVTGPRDIITEPFLGVLDEDLSKAAKQALETGTREQRAKYVSEHYTWPAVAQQFLNGISGK